LQGFSTAPNSPSVNSRSNTLGPSLSLGNISGMTANPEVKKRRAPPPPVATPPLQHISHGASLNDLQKKKRRAPLPPSPSAPPTPAMPNRTEGREDKRKSTMGAGRRAPAKPPRGGARGPPPVATPPPPPCPPPATAGTDPAAPGRGAEAAAPTELGPEQSLQPAHDNVYVVDDVVLELSEVEETASESSCFASEDTTEDSGVVSSPSDIVSLDSQNGSVKLRDKWVNGCLDSAEADPACGREPCPAGAACSDNVASDSTPESASSSRDGEDSLLTAQLQQTLADLDEDLEAVENISNSDSEYVTEALSPHARTVEAAQDITVSVPVTIIDEVAEVNIPRSAGNQEMRSSENISADSVNAENFTNKNNNAGSFDKGHIGGGSICVSKDLDQHHQQPSENEFDNLPVEQRRDKFESLTSSFEKRSEKNLKLEPPPKPNAKSEEYKSKLIPSYSKATTEISTAKEQKNPFKDCSKRERPLKKSKSELEIKQLPTKRNEEKVEEIPSTPTWCHRVQHAGTSYEPKMGLTTFKVVPPKPEVKHFDRGVSLSTGAIKIDELGNLITPNAGSNKSTSGTTTLATDESEEIPLGKVKEFWRSNSMEKQSDDSAEHLLKKSAVTTNSKTSFTLKHEHKPVCLVAPKPAAPQTVTSQVGERQFENEKTKPPLPATQSQVKPLVAPAINKDKAELPFLKPHRRTSSQYVASAIAKHINLPTFKSDSTEYHEKEENKPGAGEVKTEGELFPKRCIIVAKYSPVETDSAETREAPSNVFTSSLKVSHRFTPGDNSGAENKTVNIRAPNQATPSFYKKNGSVPLSKSSSKDNNVAEDDHSLSSKQNIVEKKMHLLLDQKCETLSHTNSAPSLKSPDLQAVPPFSSSSLRAGKWPPAGSLQAGCFKASWPEASGAAASSHAECEREDKHDGLAAGAVAEADVNVQTNIFGPKKKFKPVVQKPIPKDTSLHSALMEAIQTAGGKEKLRKISDTALNGSQKKPSYVEPENERSALLAAIRGHSGTSKLKKISSVASEELQSFRNAELSLQKAEDHQEEQFCIPPPPIQPPPPAPPSAATAPKSSAPAAADPAEARQALMEAIRSGAGAAKLKKVNVLL
ncbi:COBL protein, partial [Nothoprocta pentlandii]|nr:COBL protein [Nothoprocta pentlandii]